MQKKPLAALIATTLILVGCGETENIQTQTPLPLVETQRVILVEHQQSKSYIGRIEAIEDTNITAHVSGYLQARHFKEGQLVEKGDLLYTIEPSSFEAQLASAKAAVAQANAVLKKAQLDHVRGNELLPRGSISQSEFDALTAALHGGRAELEAAKAKLKLAEVNLSYTQIRAPFNGRISDSKVSSGDLVSPSTGVLATLVSLDPINTAFSASERERIALGMDKIKGDGTTQANGVEVLLELENGEQYPYLGQLNYLGNRINLDTGTIDMRAVIPNPEQRLLPGQHIKINLRESVAKNVIVIPRRAVQTDLEGDFVMVMSDDNIAERRNVDLGPQVEQGISINQGLSLNDVVITQGLQRVRNGVEVRTQTPTTTNQ
ncbi:efflux RND transporter periplasmic adaptor subunit [Vibrio aestuarianus]|uniref:efflux RND transporter periplasmic adaptor subunit n=1 Tax=Vibrio aestuarianus TaxID=28171 RepID=UPI001593AA95|nr:efflux RND transporter periplasmic adaptor subunit [Vibrio aestuarianus]MDE1210950.1 efflux RND transporter periplasmic adaptor subunit [Vibrio aestuarianus]MDE1311706.1 efflux RND transporter periplasmic adaptor subunit [Vibrio aestuarianus]MDE1319742.1 efflux RND transporter periplasmic adaptor subunit [Vibrio aestuarianus]NGZ93656.1 efflux RND transporter periplasmic adaptor subunit [Vibrio aestuarianus subsp. cardii]CAH8240425.1 Membrane protein [Vibrio aestuarianus]